MQVDFNPGNTTNLSAAFRAKPLSDGVLAVFSGGLRPDRFFAAWLMAGELGLPLVQTPVGLAGCVSFIDNREIVGRPLPGSVVVLSFDSAPAAMLAAADLVIQFSAAGRPAITPPAAPNAGPVDRIDACSNFDVVIGGVSYGFSEVTAPACVAYASRGIVYPNIVLRRAVTLDTSLYGWGASIGNPVADLRTVAIAHLDPSGSVIRVWWIEGAWPVRWTGPAFDAMASRPAMEEIEICISRFEWISGGK